MMADKSSRLALDRYRDLVIDNLGFGTVRDYCDSVEYLPEISTLNNDIKDMQRPWVVKAILANVPVGGSLLEVGAGTPFVAQFLLECGYEVSVIDPYDGRDRGPATFDMFQAEYPGIIFYKGLFPEALQSNASARFDCIYSVSVLEHVTFDLIAPLARSMKYYSRNGTSKIIHAIDFIKKGVGSEQSFIDLREWLRVFGYRPGSLDLLNIQIENDAEAYFLSAASHNMWRGGVPYAQYPMRRINSINVSTEAGELL